MSRDTHLDRKSLKRPDSFVQLGGQLLVGLISHGKGIGIAAGGLALATAAYYGYAHWADSRLDRDWLGYYQAVEAPAAERVGKLKAFYESASNSRAKQMAAVALADSYATSQQAKARKTGTDSEPSLSVEQAGASAAEWYGKALEFSGLMPVERDLLTLNVGTALETSEKWQEALARYEAVAKGNSEAKPLGMIHQARVLERQSKVEEAKKLYVAVSTDYPTTDYARVARNYLRQMDSPLLGAPGKQ